MLWERYTASRSLATLSETRQSLRLSLLRVTLLRAAISKIHILLSLTYCPFMVVTQVPPLRFQSQPFPQPTGVSLNG